MGTMYIYLLIFASVVLVITLSGYAMPGRTFPALQETCFMVFYLIEVPRCQRQPKTADSIHIPSSVYLVGG